MRKNIKILTAFTLSFLVLSPSMALAEIDFAQLVVLESITPEEKFAKKFELTQNALGKAIERAESMKTGLEALSFEKDSVEVGLKDKYLAEADSYLAFYKESKEVLSSVEQLEDLNVLIQKVIDYRENIYAPSAKNVLEFILVFSYSPSVLETANKRFESIKSDVERLENLSLLESGLFSTELELSQKTLEEAGALQTQAKLILLSPYMESLSEDLNIEEGAPTAKQLAEESLNKIKGLYTIFIETGQRVKNTLGI